MADYKLYFLGKTGRVEARLDLQANDDAQAIVLAEREDDGRAMELWHGERVVKRYPPKEPKH